MAQRQYLRTEAIPRSAEIDRGLQAYMSKVYALMAGAMIITGLVAYLVGMDFRAVVNGQETTLFPESLIVTMFSSPVRWIIMFAPLAFVFLFSATLHKMSAGTAQTVFWIFGGVMGLSIAWIFAVFTGISIARTFFVTAIAFGGLSI